MHSGLFYLLIKLPWMISFLEKLCHLILRYIESYHKKKLKKQMDQAIDLSKKKKDTSRIENLFRQDKNK